MAIKWVCPYGPIGCILMGKAGVTLWVKWACLHELMGVSLFIDGESSLLGVHPL